ncbi:hypothetical protein WN55_03944 [Dufourea novaeangliae]|uniref:TWiK family of potassium channels protein 7 n=1 Tax=Dufourea novaeangliae TaxID=178035 RepID=A0A154PKY1_DUFNO|nr:hypothetical protein WN55_03944 [Dufourea novaeangliae]
MSSSPGARKAPPRPKIQLPLPGQYYPQTYVPTPYGQTPIPMTPVSGQPQVIYSNRASEFVFSQFKGIKDLTKSGLSVGEKSAFWLNETLTVIRELWNDEILASNTELWDGRARNELMKYEEHLYEFYKRGVTDRGQKVWTFWNAVFYCGTIYTTIEVSNWVLISHLRVEPFNVEDNESNLKRECNYPLTCFLDMRFGSFPNIHAYLHFHVRFKVLSPVERSLSLDSLGNGCDCRSRRHGIPWRRRGCGSCRRVTATPPKGLLVRGVCARDSLDTRCGKTHLVVPARVGSKKERNSGGDDNENWWWWWEQPVLFLSLDAPLHRGQERRHTTQIVSCSPTVSRGG